MDTGVIVYQDLLRPLPVHAPGTQIPVDIVTEVAPRPAAGSLLAHATAMAILNDVRVRADGVIYGDEVRLSTAESAVANVGEVLGEGRQVIVGIGTIGDVVARSYGATDDSLIGIQIAAGVGIAGGYPGS